MGTWQRSPLFQSRKDATYIEDSVGGHMVRFGGEVVERIV